MNRLLVIDTETGGLDPQLHSILSLAAVVWTDGVLGAEFEVLIAEPVQTVTARALKENNINIVEHCEQAVTPTAAVASFQSFLMVNMSEELASKNKIALAGHNISFDVGFLNRLYRQADVRFEGVFSHRLMDTAGVLRFLTLANLLPLSGAGLDEALKFFAIDVPEKKRHTALGDARATAQLLTKLVHVAQRRDPSTEKSAI